MKRLLILLTLLSSFRGFSVETNKDSILFSRPLILGASVSRGHGTTDGGPGMVISKMINPEAEVTNKSMSGHTSLESTRNLDYFATQPSIVLTFDLFFWDASREGFDEMGSPVSQAGVRYFSDRLHTTNAGNRFCAEIFVTSGVFRKLRPQH